MRLKFSILLFVFLGKLISPLYAIDLLPNMDSASIVSKLPQLDVDFGSSLTCPAEYRLAMLIALSRYPELKNVPIIVQYANLKTTATSRPATSFVLKNHSLRKDTLHHQCNRKYIIRINQRVGFEGVLLKCVPFNAKIGVLGHELAHIVDYERRSAFRVMKRGSEYLSNKGKRRFEHEIDSITIVHGLGWQLHDWADFVLNKSTASEHYKFFKKTTYMLPNEIIVQIKRTNVD